MRSLVLVATAGACAGYLQSVEWALQPATGSVCPFDLIQVTVAWAIEATHELSERAIVGLVHVATDELVANAQVELDVFQTSENDQPSGLRCEFDAATCQPIVDKLVVPNRPNGALQAGDVLDVTFQTDTNEPPVATKEMIEAILDLPVDFGSELRGVWATPRLLRIEIVNVNSVVWIRDIKRSPTVKVDDAPSSLQSWSYASLPTAFRIGIPGEYKFVLRLDSIGLGEPLRHGASPTFVIGGASCAPATIIQSLNLEPPPAVHSPTYAATGLLALDGQHALTLPHATVVTSNGTWSLVFWLYLAQDATGEFRTLFYKGPGTDQHRTPSAWLRPNDRKLILRVSTDEDMDVGVTTISALPLQRWVLLSFVFRNLSDAYEVEMSMNGRVDTTMRVTNATVLPNTGGLYLGDNPWMAGLRGLVSRVRMFDYAVAPDHCARLFAREQEEYFRQGVPAQVARILEPAHDARGLDATAVVLAGLGPMSAGSSDEESLVERGASLLFGQRWAGTTYADDVQNSSLAREYLETALRQGNWHASKYLGLLLSPSRPHEAVSLYHVAAMMGDFTAMAILARKYIDGTDGLAADVETGSHYYVWTTAEAARSYHLHGEEPLHEMNSLFHADKVDVTEGQAGDDDKWIQFQKMRADVEGDTDAMAAMGDLYYWGARGCTRDHARAFSYFARAADRGHVVAMTAAAGMLLKGEGTAQDNATAIELYEKAAAADNVRALNGLGYLYFYGTANCTQNQTRGLAYFEAAASHATDGDSLFNAGYCHLNGLGSPVNRSRAVEYLMVAARTFGHFDAVVEMSRFWLNAHNDGSQVRDTASALPYLQAATAAGPWAKSARVGFDLFRRHHYRGALWHYHEALELGYPVAAGNLAYLYGLLGENNSAYLMRATEIEANVRLGDCYYYGKGGVERDARKALALYSQACADGLAVGAYNAGFIYEHGDDGVAPSADRARQYYARALELSPTVETYLVVYVSLARLMLGLSHWSSPHLHPSSSEVAATVPAVGSVTVAALVTSLLAVLGAILHGNRRR
ncbi:hypothetical protein ACHHYP_10426 [Achlya hypogyna]|uniref:Secreted protein n=1 Tax=Achlya hypogyna TaxID=1202772 RepID=A0A1V9YLH8_ACHHY|nr:hypothetical protein ACHHYP_10426 [Achlya hypogyna]